MVGQAKRRNGDGAARLFLLVRCVDFFILEVGDEGREKDKVPDG